MTATNKLYITSFLLVVLFSISLSPVYSQTASFKEVLIDVGYARFVTHVWPAESADAEAIFALPGSGADVFRYKDLGPILANAGYQLIAINQRGILGSSGNLAQITLRDLANDVIAIADKMGIEKFHMAGWAFGNRTSRMLATTYPERLASLILIAAGGLVQPLTVPGELAKLLDDQTLSEDEKIYLARRTMFSPKTDISIIRDYVQGLTYWPEARKGQSEANKNTPLEEWAAGGKGPVLMIMGKNDLTAPIENGYRMKAEHGERLTLITIDDTGHAVGLEKPTEVAEVMIAFLQKHSI
jgi:pimeloyl-ACP methyl ester carboxylesterase